MKYQVDTEARTITILEAVPLADLYDYFTEGLPDEFFGYDIIPTVTQVTTEQQTITWPLPFGPYPVTVATDSITAAAAAAKTDFDN